MVGMRLLIATVNEVETVEPGVDGVVEHRVFV